MAQLERDRQAAKVIQELRDSNALATCEMVALEQLYPARNLADRESIVASLLELRWLKVTTAVMRRALDVQGMLIERGHHRLPVQDLVIAATAELHRAVVLHYDKDYDVIASVTGQPTRWIVPRGSAG